MDSGRPGRSGDPPHQLAVIGAAIVIACLAVVLLWAWIRFGSLDKQTRQLTGSATPVLAASAAGGGGSGGATGNSGGPGTRGAGGNNGGGSVGGVSATGTPGGSTPTSGGSSGPAVQTAMIKVVLGDPTRGTLIFDPSDVTVPVNSYIRIENTSPIACTLTLSGTQTTLELLAGDDNPTMAAASATGSHTVTVIAPGSEIVLVFTCEPTEPSPAPSASPSATPIPFYSKQLFIRTKLAATPGA
jgi:hypothetical protein